MSRMSHHMNSLSMYSKDDSCMQQLDDQDSKKSKSSKGILSRASHKIKKRLAGSNNSSSGSECKSEIERGRSMSADVSSAQYVRGGRDPSPSGGSVGQRQLMRPLNSEHQMKRSSEQDIDGGVGPFYDDQGNLVEDFQSVDFSDMSTLESNFTHPIGDVMVNSPWAKEQQAANSFILGTPPRAPKTGGTISSGKRSSSERSQGMRSHKQEACNNNENSVDKEKLKTDQSAEGVLVEQNEHRLSTEVVSHAHVDADSFSVKSSISQLEAKVLSLETKLRNKEEDVINAAKQKDIVANELERSNETLSQLAKDLDSYKKECASQRERVLQSERENTKMEQLVYNERKKVLSLEAENQMLLNLADEKVGNATNAEKARQSEMNVYKEQCKKYRDRVIQLEQKVSLVC